MDLQLYQIDQHTYLLDFKCVLPNTEASGFKEDSSGLHLTIEYFEMCAKLISALAQ